MKKIVFILSSVITTYLNAQEPTFEWAKTMGGDLNDIGSSLVVDAEGNIYSTGYYLSETVDFNPDPDAAFNLSSQGGSDIYISKLDQEGNFIWAKSIGGVGGDFVNSITLDNAGNILLAGSFSETVDFDPDASGTAYLSSLGTYDMFLLKLDMDGNFMWVKGIGGAENDEITAIKLDESDNIYLTGYFRNTVDFDLTDDEEILSSIGEEDIFIAKLDTDGNLIWVKGLTGLGRDFGRSIAVDGSGFIYISGLFELTVDFNPLSNETNPLTSSGLKDIFILKLDTEGNFLWVKGFGNLENDFANDLTIDSFKNIYLTGSFKGIVDFNPNEEEFNGTSMGDRDMFILKLNNEGNFQWVKIIGGPAFDDMSSMIIDQYDHLYATGRFIQTVDFDPNNDTHELTSLGLTDVFFLKLNSNGEFIWAKNVGGTDSSYTFGKKITLDVSGNIYTTGAFSDTVDFDPYMGVSSSISLGNNDVFIHKLNQSWLSISENKIDCNFVIYPNPTHDILKIEINSNIWNLEDKNIQIKLVNSLGQVLINKDFISNQLEVDMKNLTNGVYLLTILNQGKTITIKKIIKN